ncbi:unnamed protein product [Macrosiphum euphorbiae]|uniref:Zinc finger MYM-type protein 1 n=1 Tax=Macrosiphum euphorbiae TaxID=13131 RepID=A0AAV0Y437_9HEMI|nr:unnamed protein product [Macrosiphum euphorbiae]
MANNIPVRDPASKTSTAFTLFIENYGPYQPIDVEFIKINEKTFTNVGFKNWKKGIEKFTQHQKCNAHKESTCKLSSYTFSKKNGSVISELNLAHKNSVTQNREYIRCLLKTLLFCARQGIAMRGHNETEMSTNCGNFLELLKLRAHDNAIIHKYYIEKEMSFTYTNPEYQNLFLKYMADSIKKSIIKDIQSNGFYSILVDETQDLSYHEQVSIYIRYVDQHFVPHEVFLDLNNVRGQCYDGAASMRGSYSGVQSRIKEENPLALYVHCYAHILNLCIVDLAKSVPMSPKNNYATVKDMAMHTIESLKDYRCDSKFNELWILSKTVCDQNKLDTPKIPRMSKVPNRHGGGAKQAVYQDVQHYFKINFFFPLLDLLINDISNRFSENDLDILQALYDVLCEENPSNDVIKRVCTTYSLTEVELKGELSILNKMLKNSEIKDSLENRIDFFNKNNLKGGFENYSKCLTIFLSIPTNTASNERSFSSLKKLKTYLRLTMGQTRLSSIATLYIERDREVDFDQVINEFDEGAPIRGRRLVLR